MFFRKIVIFLIIIAPGYVFAQTMQDSIYELPQIEVRADRIFQKENAGMKETQVDSLVISHKLNLTLSDLLSGNTSVFIKNHGRGALASASFRGTAPSHTQVTWNGININTPMAGMVDFSLIPVYIIDEMNLKHGTASIVDGSGGLGGSINIGNRADWDNTFMARYVQGLGSYKTFDQYLMIGFGNPKFQWRTRVYHNQSKNNYTFINKHIGHIQNGKMVHLMDTNKNADYARYGFLQELYFQPANNHIISAKYWGQYSDRAIPKAISYEGPQNNGNFNPNNQTDIDHKILADWKYYLSNGQFLVRTGFSEKQLDFFLHNQVSGLGLVPAIYSESTQKSYLNHAGYNYEFTEQFSLESSVDVNYHHVNTQDSVTKIGYQQDRIEYSWLFAARQSIRQKLNVNLMLRQNWYNNQRAPLVPFLGFDFKPWPDKVFILKANVAKNYHQPTLNDLYWQPGGNPDLLPEKGWSFELGLQYQRVFEEVVLQSEITYYRSDIDDWIIWIPSFKGYWEPQNIKKVVSQGLEFNTDLKGKLGSVLWRTNATYAYTSAINYGDPLIWGDESYGKQLVYIPVHSGNVLLHLAYKGLAFTWQHNSYSERFTTSSNDVQIQNPLYPYYMNDVTLSRDFNLNPLQLAVEFKVYNLFNETYRSVLYRPMPGRNFMLLIRLGI